LLCFRASAKLEYLSEASANFEYVPAMASIARETGALLMEHFDRNIKIEYKGEADMGTAAGREKRKDCATPGASIAGMWTR
jgi:hypothetical protein